MRNRYVRLGLVVALAFFFAACSTEVSGQPEPRLEPAGNVVAGRQLIAAYGCGSCHTIPLVPGANAKAAPPLDHFWERMYIAGRLSNNEDNLVKWIHDPQSVDPGNAMPNLGVSEGDARNIAAYLYHQPTILEWINR